MTRKEFIHICGLFGLGLPFHTALASGSTPSKSTFSGKVIIIGAGAAGLSAGYLLKQRGIDFKILEAAPGYGGRMKTNHDFADFPIPLGAEWVTSNTLPFNQIVGNRTAVEKIDTVGYTQNDEYGVWYNDKLVRGDLGKLNYRKFINSSWLNFFEEFIIPAVTQHIHYQTAVRLINYSDKKVIVKTQTSEFTADRIIVTAPITMLQNETIRFTPALSKKKLNAINNASMWDGLKVFMEFKKKFYPAFTDLIIHPETDGQVSYYDASFGQNSKKNVLGLFAVGKPAKKYGAYHQDDLKDHLLSELDEIFEGQASPNYLKHITQNWSNEPFIECAYLNDYEDSKIIRTLQESVADKIFFAGDGYTSGNDWGNVHNAIESARQSVNEILDEYN
ncbi:FAD-dependent oxidoreductase [Fulvivirga sp. M361]|uniref:flavin monoamine oxidase family protein n=1 Tax=Fulvivirga sp. M361 TaxID=2594266 RepID=UPI00117AE344|nr:FAD-dependent oxidoreductase [Fulvivirga sp. M361]TRX48694.1 FAD-dependent oxidoreductase [Fulvivirga sp. M361]